MDISASTAGDTTLETKPQKPVHYRRAIVGASVGTFVEFFDYAVYSTMAAIMSAVFFSDSNSTVALVQTFAVFALSFLTRPVGALFWGHFGDRIGRRRTLGITIMLMGAATAGVGLLPGHAQIGILAPVLLMTLRMVQSFCAAGELSGASVLIGEYAPVARRARQISLVAIAGSTGLLAATLMSTTLQAILSQEDMMSWGWRIPFLLGGPLAIVGWFIRRKVDESPAFRKLQELHQVSKAPVWQGIKTHWKPMLRLTCVMSINAGAYYLSLTYFATYLETVVKLDSFSAHLIGTITVLAYVPLLYLFGWATDVFGRKTMLVASCLSFLLFSYPAFALLGQNGTFAIALMVSLLLASFLAMSDASFATLFVESFPANIRFSGFAIPFNFGVALFSGTAPLAATWLISETGSPMMPAFVVMSMAALALTALLFTKETKPRSKSLPIEDLQRQAG